MRTRPELAALVAASCALSIASWASRARAQPNLPPPPPPPMDQRYDAPALPPPPAPSQPSSPEPSSPQQPSPRRATPPPPPPYRASSPGRQRRVVERPSDEVVYVEPPATHALALTLNPVPLFFGRVSANVEVQLVPHHSLVVSPNVLLWHVDRGGQNNLVSEGLGFASPTSAGVGVELGYHYWSRWSRELRGPFVGPSVLVGGTTQANVGDPSHMQAYWGLAFDAGWQEVLPVGFTAGIGAGLGYLRMADNGALFPRLLIQLGWSF